MKLEPTIYVTLGERKLTLTDVMSEAINAEGVTHIVLRRGAYPSIPHEGEMVDEKRLQQLVTGMISIHDMTYVVDVQTGEQAALYDLNLAARQHNVMELVKK